MTHTVSVVIPTIGRPSVQRAVKSALEQTQAPSEIIVVADREDIPSLPTDDRIRLVRTTFHSGPARARQIGIDVATGSLIAMLDDDDEWHPNKLERQLHAVESASDDQWIVSSRMAVHGPGERRRTWPRRLIEPGQLVTDYLFRFTDLVAGGAELQTSTLLFPTALARAVRWDTHSGATQDEPSWLIGVQRAFPKVRIIQLPDVLSVYNIFGASVSRQPLDCTDSYIDWGIDYLADEPARVLGDYLCTYPVSAAVSARSLRGVWRALRAALRYGRPGPYAVNYAVLSAVRVMLASARSAVRG